MREKMLTDCASNTPLLVVLLVLNSLVPLSSSCLRSANAAPPPVPTSIIGNTVSGNFSTQVLPPSGNIYGIQGGLTAGKNLFHSFSQFNLGPGDIAQFQTSNLSPTAAISNILGRINGQQSPSQIFGTIDSATYYPAASLFLMNPSGFLFGPNASVNVGGMMTFTTADYIRLANGGRFNAKPNTLPGDNLISADVVAFGFLDTNLHPAPITFEGGQLTVAGGTGVTLVGGDISLTPDSSVVPNVPSSITAPGRSIQLTSVAGPGEVAADTGMPSPRMTLGTITLGQGSSLSTAGVDSLFRDGSGGAISIRGGQLVATGATITTSPALGSTGIGGDITISVTGSATFTNSQIQTGPLFDFDFLGVGSAGAVSITADAGLTMTNTPIDTSTVFAGGDAGPVTLTSKNGPIFLTNSTITTQGSAPGNGGAVTITGKDVTLNNSNIFTAVDTAFFDVTSDPALGKVHPGAVTVTAENTVTISGSGLDPSGLPITMINAGSSGTLVDAGTVTITGKTVNLANGTVDVSMHNGGVASPGNGGTIEIRGDNINLSLVSLQSLADGINESTSKGGNIHFVGSDGVQLANNIQMTSSQLNTNATAGGGAGTIEFQTKALTLSDSQVSAATFGLGPGGSIKVQGAENVTLLSNSVFETTAINSGPGQTLSGPAGSILLETQQLTMQGGSSLRSGDLPTSRGDAGSITVRGTNGSAQSILIDGSGTGIFTDAEGNGAGGSISVNANSVTIQNGAALSATTSGTGLGGSIGVNANTVTMTSGATITANSTGTANAGDINITAINGLSMQNSSITTLVPPSGTGHNAGGGNIKITTSPAATVYLQDSTISASVADGQGGGGNISIDPQFVILQNSQILAQAAQGQGGAITIIAGLFLPDATSKINADSGSGQNGTITIQSPIAPASGKILPLPQKPLIATTLLSQRCAALAGGEFSSFTVAGRDSLPAEPGGWLSSPLALAAAEFEGGTVTESGMRANFSESVRETSLLSLRQIAPPGFLTQAFAVDWSAGCTS